MSSSSDSARSSRAIVIISGSSVVPSTAEWLARICSRSVEPERGMPTMKIGLASGQPDPARAREEIARENRLRGGGPAPCSGPGRRGSARGAAHCLSRSARKTPHTRPRPRSALPSAKCRLTRSDVVDRRVVGRASASPRGRRRSKRKVLRLARLQYASPKAGSCCDRAPIGSDALVQPALGLQHVAVAEPDLGVRRVLLRELRVQAARALVLADAARG